MELIAVLLICKAVSFGVEVNHQPQCAEGAPGLVDSRPVPGVYSDPGRCAAAAYDATKPLRMSLAAKGEIATWVCKPK